VNPQPRPVALSIAGSDSGGGAGIQADLRVFHRLGAFGTSAITAITAQNLQGVTDVVGLPPQSVRAQIDAVLGGFAVRAVKTGMLWSAEIVASVADVLATARLPAVVDPVMVATSGARLLDASAIANYRKLLIPRAALVTPNLDEAAVLLDRPRIDERAMPACAEQLFLRFGAPVLLKGGHLDGDPVDLLRYQGGIVAWRHPRVLSVNTHGSGCMLAAAIAARLAHGDELATACAHGLAFVHDALVKRLRLHGGVELADIEHAEANVAVLTRVEF
jgi:hydroxymethylpyrimidine kinase/phosphomethylpyrimidine kinase